MELTTQPFNLWRYAQQNGEIVVKIDDKEHYLFEMKDGSFIVLQRPKEEKEIVDKSILNSYN